MLELAYFSDVLCIWAYIGEKRVTEVQKQLGDKITINCHFLTNFAACDQKIHQAWSDRGGYEGFAQHVQKVASDFGLDIHEKTWSVTQPTSSMPIHIAIKAVQAEYHNDKAMQYAFALRAAFFKDGIDISQQDVYLGIAEDQGIDSKLIEAEFATGIGFSRLHQDIQLAQSFSINVSPSWVFNEGRQKLVGNVGYRVIEANIHELLNQDPNRPVWC